MVHSEGRKGVLRDEMRLAECLNALDFYLLAFH